MFTLNTEKKLNARMSAADNAISYDTIANVPGILTFKIFVQKTRYVMMPDGSEAIITAIQVTSPKGVKYNGVGVTPDYEVDNTEVPRELPDFIVFSHANYQQAVFGADNEVVEALEQRLVLLGVMREADSVFDQDTAQALAIYQKNMGLEQTGELDLLTFQSITDLVNAVKNVRYVHDDQLDKAVELITAP